jgi:anti-sigma factor RsiW
LSAPPPADDSVVHTRVREQFSDYLEGTLDLAARKLIDDHLAGCPACTTELAQFRSTLGRLGGLRTKAPGSFLADIQNQIHTRSKGRFFSRRRLFLGRIPFEWVSLAMILAMLVYYIYTTHSVPTHVAPGP